MVAVGFLVGGWTNSPVEWQLILSETAVKKFDSVKHTALERLLCEKAELSVGGQLKTRHSMAEGGYTSECTHNFAHSLAAPRLYPQPGRPAGFLGFALLWL